MLAAVLHQATGGRCLRERLLTAQARFHQPYWSGAHPHHVRSNLAPSLRMLSVKPYGPFPCWEKRSFRGDEQVQLKWLSSG